MTPPLPAGFTDVQTLAETGHGTMYQATVTTADGRADRVAVVLAPAPIRDRAARRRLRADCLAVTPVNGEPGILAIRELSFTSENQPYLVSDPAPHGTLAQRLERSGPLSVGDVAAMAQTLTRALSAAHGLGVLHLGIGPDAVFLLSGTPSVALGHFGLAWAVRPPSQPDVAAAAVVHAPRESFGWDEPTTATDAYSLASTLRTALVGQAPYAAEAAAGRAALYHRVLQGGPAPMARPDVPAALLTILDRMLDPEPAKRPGLDELGAVLEAIARGNGSVLSVPPLPRPGNMPIPTVVPTLAEPLPATLVVPTTAIPTPAQVQPTVVLPQAAPMPHASLPPGYPPGPPAPYPSVAPDYPPAPEPPVTSTSSPPTAPTVKVHMPPPLAGAAPPVPPQPFPTAAAPVVPQQAVMLPPWLDPIDPSRSPAAPPAPPTPSPQPRQKPPARPARGERTNLVLLAAAAGIALVAGIVWGIVTGGANSGPATATQPTPTHGQAVGATMFPSALQASYRPVSVTVTAGSAAEAIVSWSAPAGSDAAVDSYLVGYNHFGVQEPPVFVSRAEHSVRIKGLKPGTHYEFTVSALILLPGDPADHLASSAAVGFDTAAG